MSVPICSSALCKVTRHQGGKDRELLVYNAAFRYKLYNCRFSIENSPYANLCII